MICKSCGVQLHELCPGFSLCDCQHRGNADLKGTEEWLDRLAEEHREKVPADGEYYEGAR